MPGAVDILRVAAEQIGKPYRWGAVGPDRFDCSGFVLYVGRLLGVSLEKRYTAAGFRGTLERVASPGPASLCYWRNRQGRIYHIAIVETVQGNIVRTIGAHGGGPSTVTDEIARRQGATVCRKAYRIQGIDSFTVFPAGPIWIVSSELEPYDGDDDHGPEEVMA